MALPSSERFRGSVPFEQVFRYAVWGVDLRSDLRLPSLRSATEGAARGPEIALVHSREPFGDPTAWLYTAYFDEETRQRPWRGVGLCERGHLVRLFGAADFLLEKEGRTARVFVDPAASVDVVEPLFLEQALPLWLSLMGRPCLHASAVAWGEGDDARAIAFAGRSGSGKSTLATKLAAGPESGGLVSDDCLALEIAGDRILAHPGNHAVRLLTDSARALFDDAEAGELSFDGDKRRIDVRAADRALPLARFYVLEPGAAEARVTPLRPRDALASFATHLFRADPEDYGRLPAELDVLDRLASGVRVARLEVPRRYGALDEVRAAIAEDLRSSGA